ncbi:hypothetical protein DOTSEDRAFT_69644 [Dothistroma septosporum NZE10]|uniref:Uncharacterized protein n=1 Tax=Dothistroma septosporum (strain NZE10 / CBS 128990) TaxID=675120 RepID=N1PXP8_DOTSN|nr:hypothetical protein DOTSEDRAFT_69644 [Dothistroma septosporum NZE10]
MPKTVASVNEECLDPVEVQSPDAPNEDVEESPEAPEMLAALGPEHDVRGPFAEGMTIDPIDAQGSPKATTSLERRAVDSGGLSTANVTRLTSHFPGHDS